MEINKCFAEHPTTGKTIIITKGESGYAELQEPMASINYMELNEKLGITKEQAEAMIAGSMFGWDISGDKTKD